MIVTTNHNSDWCGVIFFIDATEWVATTLNIVIML